MIEHLDRPRPFEGTHEEALANYETHQWAAFGDEVTCRRCDAQPTDEAARYPCGARIPRMT